MNGFRDQRLALQWGRVTIQGESSGGTSVGAQLLAYNGRDDKLFANAIAESGNPVRVDPYPTVEDWEPVIANISAATGCSNATDLLNCLRAVPSALMNDVINSTATSGAEYDTVIDGDFIVATAAAQLEQGNFYHVPYIIGCNTDEGAGNVETPINTTSQFLNMLQSSESFDAATAQDLAILYPDIPNIGIPATYPGRPNVTYGLQFKRAGAVLGDLGQHGPRRWSAMQWAKNGGTAYTYRFNIVVRAALMSVLLYVG